MPSNFLRLHSFCARMCVCACVFFFIFAYESPSFFSLFKRKIVRWEWVGSTIKHPYTHRHPIWNLPILLPKAAYIQIHSDNVKRSTIWILRHESLDVFVICILFFLRCCFRLLSGAEACMTLEGCSFILFQNDEFPFHIYYGYDSFFLIYACRLCAHCLWMQS